MYGVFNTWGFLIYAFLIYGFRENRTKKIGKTNFDGFGPRDRRERVPRLFFTPGALSESSWDLNHAELWRFEKFVRLGRAR